MLEYAVEFQLVVFLLRCSLLCQPRRSVMIVFASGNFLGSNSPAGTSTLNFSWPSTLNFSWIWKLNGCWKMTLDQRHISTLSQCWINVDATLIQRWINVDARFNQRWIFSIFYSNITSLVFSHSNIFHGREFITTLLTKRYEKGYMVYWQHYKKVW